jgi:hypothetical protein
VVVLFAKVEIPRPWRRWICKSQDSRDACITKFTPDPDEYPNRIGPICWEITMIPVPTSGETLRDSIWFLAPGLTTNRQSAQSGNCFPLTFRQTSLDSLWLLPPIPESLLKAFDLNFLQFKIQLLGVYSFTLESIDFVILSSPGIKNNPQLLITSELIYKQKEKTLLVLEPLYLNDP